MKYNEICDFRDLVIYSHDLEKRIEKQQKDIKYLRKELVTYKLTLNNYIRKDTVKKVIKKYYYDYETQKRYRYTRDVEEEQSVLKDIEKEILEEGDLNKTFRL